MNLKCLLGFHDFDEWNDLDNLHMLRGCLRFRCDKRQVRRKRWNAPERIFILFLLCCLMIPVLSSVEASTGKALCVGVDFPDGYLSNDAVTMAQALQAYGYQVTTLVNAGATRSLVISELNDLKTFQGKVVVFISAKRVGEDTVRLYNATFTESDLSGILQQYVSQELIVIINTCQSGEWLDGFTKGIFITACDKDEVTYYISFFKNCIFVEYFADKGIIQGLADSNGDGTVSIEEAFNYAYNNCADPPGALTSTYPQMIGLKIEPTYPQDVYKFNPPYATLNVILTVMGLAYISVLAALLLLYVF